MTDLGLTLAGQMTEKVLVAFREITGGGEAQFHGYLLDGHVCRVQQLVGADEPALTDIIERTFAGYRLDAAEELGAA